MAKLTIIHTPTGLVMELPAIGGGTKMVYLGRDLEDCSSLDSEQGSKELGSLLDVDMGDPGSHR